MKKTTWPGNWKVSCQVCGFQFPSSEIKKRWDGVLCCQEDWDSKHPQLLIKVREETSVPSFVSKDSDIHIAYCSLEAQSAYPGLAIAGCALAGNTRYSPDFLFDLLTNGHNI